MDLLALEGHDIQRATHEPKAGLAEGRREAPDTTTGIFLRNLKTGAARVLAQTKGHQHEWSAVKQRPWADLLWHPGAERTLLIIDAVAVDFAFLRGAKHKGRFTVITRTQKNLVVRESRPLGWDKQDRRNDGVLSDERVRYSDPGEFRVVRYQDPGTGEIFGFLTTGSHLAPGSSPSSTACGGTSRSTSTCVRICGPRSGPGASDRWLPRSRTSSSC